MGLEGVRLYVSLRINCIMNKQHLIDKVKQYLKNSKIPFIEKRIEYIGIKRNFLIKNGKKRYAFYWFCVSDK